VSANLRGGHKINAQIAHSKVLALFKP